MATLKYGIPGPGGSLGKCAVCGDTFLREILLGERVDCIGLSGFDANLPVHRECGKTVLSLQGPWADIREKFPKGPMYDCFEEEFASKSATECLSGIELHWRTGVMRNGKLDCRFAGLRDASTMPEILEPPHGQTDPNAANATESRGLGETGLSA